MEGAEESQAAPPNTGPSGPGGGPLRRGVHVRFATFDQDASPGTSADAALVGSSPPAEGGSSPESGPRSSGTPDAGAVNPGRSTREGPTPDVAAPPPTACSVGDARVFVTSSLYDGDFGGVAGRTRTAPRARAAQGLGGEWRAWMSDSSTPAVAHIYASAGGLCPPRRDGRRVQLQRAALGIARARDRPDRVERPASGRIYRGLDRDRRHGQMANGGYCTYGSGGDWSSASSEASTPLVGHLDATDFTWSAAYLQFATAPTSGSTASRCAAEWRGDWPRRQRLDRVQSGE